MPNSSTKLTTIAKFSQQLKDKFQQKHQTAQAWFKSKSVEIPDFRRASQQMLAAASLAGAIAMTNPSVNQRVVSDLLKENQNSSHHELVAQLTSEEYDTVIIKLQAAAKMPPGHLPQDDELYLEQQLSDILGFGVTAQLDGNRLNHTVGTMGGEQHLRRFPGDSLDQHDAYLESGIAPNRGAFGWFTQNGELTQQAINREKYYFAVQTLYLPDWNTKHPQLKEWYKFRKMIVINPAERIAMVGVVGDAGPAAWVKKQFGGSPEIIREGKIWSPNSKGRVILLFIDDPEERVPLGFINLDDLRPAVLAQK